MDHERRDMSKVNQRRFGGTAFMQTTAIAAMVNVARVIKPFKSLYRCHEEGRRGRIRRKDKRPLITNETNAQD